MMFQRVCEAGLGADMNKGCPLSTSSAPTFSSISSCCGFSESYGSRRSFSTSAMRFLYPTICSRHAWRDTPSLRVGGATYSNSIMYRHETALPCTDTTDTRLMLHPWIYSLTLQSQHENFQGINITLNIVKDIVSFSAFLRCIWDFFKTMNSDFSHWNPIITIHSSIECL